MDLNYAKWDKMVEEVGRSPRCRGRAGVFLKSGEQPLCVLCGTTLL